MKKISKPPELLKHILKNSNPYDATYSVYESQGLFCVALRTKPMIGPTLINNVSTFLAGLELAIIPGLLLIQDPSVSTSSEDKPSACFHLCLGLLIRPAK